MFQKKLDKILSQALTDAGFITPTPLQLKSIPRIKSGSDLVCVAPQGSGKTMAIVIGVIQQLKRAVADVPRALIVVRDVEAAQVMQEQFDQLTEDMDLRVHNAMDGRRLDDIRDRIYFGSDVVIGTAKRFNELYSMSGLNLNDLKMFVVDDADKVMKMEVLSQIDRLSRSIPKSQHIVFAKIMTDRIERYAESFMAIHDILEIE